MRGYITQNINQNKKLSKYIENLGTKNKGKRKDEEKVDFLIF